MNPAIATIEALSGVTLTDYQREAVADVRAQAGPSQRLCLYYKTGAGKSITALACVAAVGHDAAVVVAPPSTHKDWEDWGRRFGVEVEAISHAKFRMKNTRLSRHKAVIADEMHMFGGQGGQGWKKLDTLARHLQAPLILASATPNYNDAERVYCIQHVLDPRSCSGGYIAFLYRECETEADPFSQQPKVLGFRNHPDAAAYLADLPGVHYLPDDLVYQIEDIEYPEEIAWPIETYGYDERRHRIIASQIEERHTRRYQGLVDSSGLIHDHVFELVLEVIESARTPVLVYADHATVAEALARSLNEAGVTHGLITGSTTKKTKDWWLTAFRAGHVGVLVGTASLATGTDGLDKVCDTLVILDDTDDDSLRRQLIGRIMPRGIEQQDASAKRVFRLVPVP